MEERLQRGIERLTIVRAVRLVASVALTLALVAAVLQRLFDPAMGDFTDALWWAIVTVTTVGYGDVIPETGLGRIIAGFLMLAGVSAIPITTSLVVSVFVSRLPAAERERNAEARDEILARLDRIEQALHVREG